MNVDSLSIESASTNSYASEEDTMDVQKLPRFPKSSSSHLIVPNITQCTRNHSFSSLTPRNRVEEQQIISSYVASNLRRSQSSASYQKTKFGASDPNIDKRKHRILSNSNRTNNMIFPSKNQASDSSSLKGRGGLSRKSSFSYVPSTERLSRTNSIVNHVEKNNLNFQEGNSCQKKSSNRTQETNHNSLTNDEVLLRQSSQTGNSRINLRDSAIDLVSDEENSEAYAAVSLAETMKGNSILSAKPIQSNSRRRRKFLIIIGILSAIIVLLGGLAMALALILFRN